MRSATG
nr:TPA_asm: M55 uORF 1 [Murid betaherpesvirus 1]DBA08008.1 TPA_asm: M55 uORF 1 [Murid betaherpesvirus 1]